MDCHEIRKIRFNLGMSARVFAIEVGLTGRWGDRTVRKWEDGEVSPKPIYVDNINMLAARN
jgi:DNA-binding transcriptional regulator YiaG